jgi:hypothetical protein
VTLTQSTPCIVNAANCLLQATAAGFQSGGMVTWKDEDAGESVEALLSISWDRSAFAKFVTLRICRSPQSSLS